MPGLASLVVFLMDVDGPLRLLSCNDVREQDQAFFAVYHALWCEEWVLAR